MMFVMPETQPTLMLLLTYEDEMKLRSGLTLYVDKRATGGRFFDQVVLSLHKTKDEIVKMIRTAAPGAKIPDHLPEPPPRPDEFRCESCQGSHPPNQLFEDTCMVCWATEAKRSRRMSN